MELKRVVFSVLVAVAALAVASDVHAFWGSRGSWGSSGGSWGSSGGSWGSSGGSWGSRGSHGGWFRRGSWGSCGSSGGSYGSHGSHGSDGGSAYIIGSSGDVYASSTPANGKIQTAKNPTTRLTLHVPEDAKVTLAGVPTKQSGETRQFSTSRLVSGQTWDNYKVVVEVDRNGQTETEERTIKLQAGEAQELSINFDKMQVAKL